MTTPIPPQALRTHRPHAIARSLAAVVGGWAFAFSFVALGIALLLRLGMHYEDAQTLVYLLAFLVFLVAFCWAFAAASVMRVWLVLAGGGVAMTALAWWLMRAQG